MVRGKRLNPELLVVSENPRTRRNSMARKARKSKHPLRVRYGKKRVSYKTLVKRLGMLKAAKYWRKAAKTHLGKKVRKCRTRRRAANHTLKLRYKGKIRSYKGLVKKYGVKRAAKYWKKSCKVSRNPRRKFFRRRGR